jgi:hypothetical protein
MQSAQLMRDMFHIPFWRSYLASFYSAKAAFVFKDGDTRDDYEKAFTYLEKYYQHINDISKIPFDADSAAKSELEWWIIRRYRQEHPPAEWEKYISETSSIVYHIPAEAFKDYAHLRVQAMLLRDQKDAAITDKDWQLINRLLASAWQCFGRTIQK